jgi:hypothetical protein
MILEKPVVVQPLMNFPEFYGSRKFHKGSTLVPILNQLKQSIPSHSNNLLVILILSPHLCPYLHNDISSFIIPANAFYKFPSLQCVSPVHLIILNLIILIIFGEECKLWSSSEGNKEPD